MAASGKEGGGQPDPYRKNYRNPSGEGPASLANNPNNLKAVESLGFTGDGKQVALELLNDAGPYDTTFSIDTKRDNTLVSNPAKSWSWAKQEPYYEPFDDGSEQHGDIYDSRKKPGKKSG